LKELAKRTKNLALTMLGALKEDNVHHGGNTTTKKHPISIMRKGRLIECYLYSQMHFMKNFPMQGKLTLLVEEEA